MLKLSLFFLTFMRLFFTSHAQLAKAEWMLGSWQQQTARGMMYEVWTRSSDSGFAGRSYMLKGKDTVVLETVRLVAREDALFYIPTVTHQNNDQPVIFKSVTIKDDQLVFENPAHDFPQRVSYVRLSADSLQAEISGTVNGQFRARYFPMRRIP